MIGGINKTVLSESTLTVSYVILINISREATSMIIIQGTSHILAKDSIWSILNLKGKNALHLIN